MILFSNTWNVYFTEMEFSKPKLDKDINYNKYVIYYNIKTVFQYFERELRDDGSYKSWNM